MSRRMSDLRGSCNRHPERNDGGQPNLAKQVAMWPTPKSRDWKGQSQRGLHAPQDALPNMDAGDGKPVGGSLNPDWVGWLMGWPHAAPDWEWTSLEPAPPGAMETMTDPWREEPAIPRVAKGVKDRVNRLKCLGNGQVPQCAALAWRVLTSEEFQ